MTKTYKKLENGKFELSFTENVIRKQEFTEKELDDNIAILQKQLDELQARKTEISKLK